MLNKGFTLIELLAVLVLLGVIAVIAVTNGLGILSDSKESLSDRQEDMIIEAAKNYQLVTNIEGYVSIDDLAEKGYLDSAELKDPKTNNTITGGVCIEHVTKDEAGNSTDKYNFEYTSTGDCS